MGQGRVAALLCGLGTSPPSPHPPAFSTHVPRAGCGVWEGEYGHSHLCPDPRVGGVPGSRRQWGAGEAGRRLLGREGGTGAGQDLSWRERKALGAGVSAPLSPQVRLLPGSLMFPASAEAEELYQKRVLTITGICVALLVVGIVCVVAYCKTK